MTGKLYLYVSHTVSLSLSLSPTGQAFWSELQLDNQVFSLRVVFHTPPLVTRPICRVLLHNLGPIPGAVLSPAIRQREAGTRIQVNI